MMADLRASKVSKSESSMGHRDRKVDSRSLHLDTIKGSLCLLLAFLTSFVGFSAVPRLTFGRSHKNRSILALTRLLLGQPSYKGLSGSQEEQDFRAAYAALGKSKSP